MKHRALLTFFLTLNIALFSSWATAAGDAASATAFTAFHDQQVLDDSMWMAGLEYALKQPF